MQVEKQKVLLLGLRWWGCCRVVIRCIWRSNHAPQTLADAMIPLKEEQNAILLSVSMEYDLKDDLNSSWYSWGRRLNRSRPKSALGAATITSKTAYHTSKSPENHEVACSIESSYTFRLKSIGGLWCYQSGCYTGGRFPKGFWKPRADIFRIT